MPQSESTKSVLTQVAFLLCAAVLPIDAWPQTTAHPPRNPAETEPVPARGEATELLRLVIDAHGGRQSAGREAESVAEGTLTLHRHSGSSATFPITLIRRGGTVQRVIKQPGGEARQGTDGSRMWDAFAGMPVPTGARAAQFVEIQTNRSLRSLMDYSKRNATVRDEGITGASHVLAVGETDGTSTRYFVDRATSRVTKLEFVSGQSRNMLSGAVIPTVESYVLSDFRPVSGVWTPFKWEHFTNGVLRDETRFTSIRENATINGGDSRLQEFQ